MRRLWLHSILILGCVCLQPPCWTEGLIFFLTNADKTLYSMQPKDEKPTPLLTGLNPMMSLAPDGMSVAVVYFQKEPDVIQVFNLETGKASPIHLKGKEIREMHYSPNGRWIAFAAKKRLPGGELNRKGPKEIFVMPAKGGALRQVTFGVTDPTDLRWSSDSRTIYYRKFQVLDRHQIWSVDIKAEAPPRRVRLFHEHAKFFPALRFYAFSPSGKEIAYATFGGIYVANADGTNHRRVTPKEFQFTMQVDWSPTGRYLVFSTTKGMPSFTSLYMLSLETGVIDLLLEMQTYIFNPTWVQNPLGVHPQGKLTTSWAALKHP